MCLNHFPIEVGRRYEHELSHSLKQAMSDIDSLVEFVKENAPLLVLTGAGCSTESGIFDYRDERGKWKLPPPQNYSHFIRSEVSRRRYWSRSMLGWPRFHAAQPNAAHKVLADLEKAGYVKQLVTQNVDDLHQQAGHRSVLALHGLLKNVVCVDCGLYYDRQFIQQRLLDWNDELVGEAKSFAPDGEAVLDRPVTEEFRVPYCDSCGGTLKPDVVFFGESIPPARARQIETSMLGCGGVLLVGTSVMVYSSYRICRRARDKGLKLAAINRGDTRVDEELTIHVRDSVGATLSKMRKRLIGPD